MFFANTSTRKKSPTVSVECMYFKEYISNMFLLCLAVAMCTDIHISG